MKLFLDSLYDNSSELTWSKLESEIGNFLSYYNTQILFECGKFLISSQGNVQLLVHFCNTNPTKVITGKEDIHENSVVCTSKKRLAYTPNTSQNTLMR